jgi:hypothetical protein
MSRCSLVVWFAMSCADGRRGDPCGSDLACGEGLVCVKGSIFEEDVHTCQLSCEHVACPATTPDAYWCQGCIDEPRADPPYCIRSACTSY